MKEFTGYSVQLTDHNALSLVTLPSGAPAPASSPRGGPGRR